MTEDIKAITACFKAEYFPNYIMPTSNSLHRMAIHGVAVRLSRYLEAIIPSFNKEEFYDACGLHPSTCDCPECQGGGG